MIARDLLLGEQIVAQAGALSLDTLLVDGSRTVAETAALLEARFDPVLSATQ